jgi:hypothetical protein
VGLLFVGLLVALREIRTAEVLSVLRGGYRPRD